MSKKPTLDELEEASKRTDVSFELNRWYYPWGNNRERVERIAKQGFKSRARQWLQSMTPECMRYGKASKSERLAEAEKFAKAAGVDLAEIAKEAGLTEMLENI